MSLVRTEKSVKVTLYTGSDDPDLPAHVKSLSTSLRGRWVGNYNWGVQETLDNKKAIEQADLYTSVSIHDLLEGGLLKEAAADEPVVVLPSFLDRLKAEWKSWTKEAAAAPTFLVDVTRPFTIYKGKDGRLRTLIVYSNIFKDSHNEIISKASHEEYASAAETGEADYPDLHLWHGGPDTKWGSVETVSFVNGFAIAGGIVDVGKEDVALKLKEQSDRGELAASFGLLGLRGPDGVYHLYRPFEISPLPVGSEANPWTSGVDISAKENDMAFSDKKKTWLKENFGYTDDGIAAAEKKFEAMAATLKQHIDYREGAGETAPAPPAVPAPVVAATGAPATAPVAAAPVAAVKAAPEPDATIMPQIEAMATAITGLGEVVKGLVAEVKALKEAAPAATAAAADDLVLAKIAGAPGGFSPTTAQSNVNNALKEGDNDGEPPWLKAAFGNILTGFPVPGAGAVVVPGPASAAAAIAAVEGK